MDNEQRQFMAAVIAAGVVRIDSNRHTDPAGVATLSVSITDEILRLTNPPEQEPQEPATDQ